MTLLVQAYDAAHMCTMIAPCDTAYACMLCDTSLQMGQQPDFKLQTSPAFCSYAACGHILKLSNCKPWLAEAPTRGSGEGTQLNRRPLMRLHRKTEYKNDDACFNCLILQASSVVPDKVARPRSIIQ
jgi:hypothetical protein